MGILFFGTKEFTKQMGCVGQKEICANCGKAYKKIIVRHRVWAHLEFIPLFPIKCTYDKICPICADGTTISHEEAQAKLNATGSNETQGLEYYAKHDLANKPKGLFTADKSYGLWVRDNNIGENHCIKAELSKDEVKAIKTYMGIKAFQFIDV